MQISNMSSKVYSNFSERDCSSDDDCIENWDSDNGERKMIGISHSPLQIDSNSSDDCVLPNLMDRPLKRYMPSSHRILSSNTKRAQKKTLRRFEVPSPMSVVFLSNSHENTMTTSLQVKSTPWLKVRRAFAPIKRRKNSLLGSSVEDVSKENSQLYVLETSIEFESSQISQHMEPRTTSPPASVLRISKSFDSIKTKPKRQSIKCRNSGFVQYLERALATARTDRRYFEHDKKFGLHSGTLMRVLYLEESFGVYIATVRIQEIVKETLRVIVGEDIARNLKTGSTLVAFFTDVTKPYTNGLGSKNETPTFVQPLKLLLL